MTTRNALELSELSVSYDGFLALSKVTMRVEDNEFVVVLGANAAGKSTLLKAIAGLVRPAHGSIVWCGEDVSRLSTAARLQRGIVYVPEGRQVLPYMTVEENLLAGAWAPHLRLTASAELERIYGLAPRLLERRKQAAGTLSGGEQQLLAICRGLMSRPRIMLVDEPSLGLSPIWMSDVFGLIAQIGRTGTALLMVEQNVVRALELASRGYVLATGECVRSGPAATLRNDDEVRRAYLGG